MAETSLIVRGVVGEAQRELRALKTEMAGVRAESQSATRAAAQSGATVAEQARAAVRRTVDQREQLRLLAAEYGTVARAARAGSAEQAAAVKLAMDAHRQLGTAAAQSGVAQARAGAEGVAAAGRLRRAWESVTASITGAGRAATRTGARSGAAAEEAGLARGFTSKATGVGGWIAGPGFIAGAVAAIAGKQAIDALRNIQEETSQLQGAVRNAGLSWAGYRGQIEKTEKAEENLGVRRADSIRSLTSLVRVTGNAEKAQRQVALATNIARGAHISLQAATQAVVQADNGRFRGLQRLIGPTVAVTKYTDELRNAHIKVTDANRADVTALAHRASAMDKAATSQRVLATATQKFAGEAQRHMHTAEGATDHLRVSVEKLEVGAGRGLLPAVQRLADWLARLADFLRTNRAVSEYLKSAWAGIVAVGKPLIALFGMIAHFLEQHRRLAMALAAVLAVLFAPIVLSAAVAVGLVIRHWNRVKAFFEALWVTLKKGFDDLWDVIKIGALYAYKAILEPFSHLPGAMGGWARRGKDRVDSEIAALKDDMATNAAASADAWGKVFGNHMASAAQRAMDRVNKIVAQGVAAGQPLGEHGAGQTAGTPGSGSMGGSAPTDYGHRVAGPTAGLTALNQALPGRKGNPAINFKGHAKKSYHYSGEALDIGDGGNPASLISDWNFLFPHKEKFAELLWDPPGHVAGRAKYPTGFYYWGVEGGGTDHHDHIHVAYTGDVSQLRQILAGGRGKPGATTAPADTSATDFATAAAAAAATGRRTSRKPRKPPSLGVGLQLSTKLDQEQQDNARLIYKVAIRAGLSPSQALEMVAAAYAESKLRTSALNKSSGAFGLFQLLSPGYRKAYEHYIDQGYDPATANVLAILPSYVKYFRSHPGAAPGEAGAAVEASGEGAGFYRAGIGSMFKLGAGGTTGGAGVSSIIGLKASIDATIRKAVQQAKALADEYKRIRADLTDAMRAELDKEFDPKTVTTQLDAVDREAIRHLRTLRAHLREGMSAADLARTRAGIKYWGDVLKTEIARQLKEATEAASRAKTLFDRQVRDVTAAVFQQFDRETEAHDKAFQRQTQLQLRNMQEAYQRQMRDFDAETQRGLQRFVVGETPEEQALRQFQEGRQAEADAQALAQAQASGDPEQIRQAMLDQQERALQKAAEQSRKAQDAMTTSQQEAYQRQRDDQRQALDDAEADREQAFQDQADATQQAYDDQRAALRQHLQDDLDDWITWINGKKKTWADFLIWLASEGFKVPAGYLQPPDEVVAKRLWDAGVRPPPGLNPGATPAQHGMVTTAPTLAMLGERPGQPHEAVIPLYDPRAMQMLRRALGGGGGGGGTNVVLANPVILGRDRRAARDLSRYVAPELNRRIRYPAAN